MRFGARTRSFLIVGYVYIGRFVFSDIVCVIMVHKVTPEFMVKYGINERAKHEQYMQITRFDIAANYRPTSPFLLLRFSALWGAHSQFIVYSFDSERNINNMLTLTFYLYHLRMC